jgi:hypothetical protein
MHVAEKDPTQRVRRNRMYMLVALICVLAATGLLYLFMKDIAAKRAAQHKQSFMSYVTANHLGTLVEIDSGTGLDPMSYVLEVNHPVPDAEKASFALDLMRRYAEYDHGTLLSISYVQPGTTKHTSIAEIHYNPVDHTVIVTVHLDSGETKTITQSVNWQ